MTEDRDRLTLAKWYGEGSFLLVSQQGLIWDQNTFIIENKDDAVELIYYFYLLIRL